MTTLALEPDQTNSPPVRWYDSTWRNRWLWLAIAALVIWRAATLVNWSNLPPFSASGLFFALMLGVQGFFLVWPLATRDQASLAGLRWPTFGRLWWEGLTAAWIVALSLVLIWIAEFVVINVFPGSSLGAKSFDDMARYGEPSFVLPMLVFAFTVPPIAEEVFFRGFLYTAFKARIPLLLAMLSQAVLFGAIHTFGVGHSIAAACLGLVLALVYEWRKSLLTPILVHAGLNFAASLGALYMMVASANAPILGVFCEPNEPNCVVRTVIPGSPAAEIEVAPGDKIIAIDHTPIESFAELLQAIQQRRAGDHVVLTMERNGKTIRRSTVLRSRKSLPAPTAEDEP